MIYATFFRGPLSILQAIPEASPKIRLALFLTIFKFLHWFVATFSTTNLFLECISISPPTSFFLCIIPCSLSWLWFWEVYFTISLFSSSLLLLYSLHVGTTFVDSTSHFISLLMSAWRSQANLNLSIVLWLPITKVSMSL